MLLLRSIFALDVDKRLNYRETMETFGSNKKEAMTVVPSSVIIKQETLDCSYDELDLEYALRQKQLVKKEEREENDIENVIHQNQLEWRPASLDDYDAEEVDSTAEAVNLEDSASTSPGFCRLL